MRFQYVFGLTFILYLVGILALDENYNLWCIGKCQQDFLTNNTSPGIVLMGGGKDTDEAFLWQIKRAAFGDFVVLRTSGDDAYNNYIYGLALAENATLNSVTTILLKNKKASSEPEVLDKLKNAEAIFLAGGDQSEYLDYWSGTEIQSIIQDKLKYSPFGGTSAGCMVQGNWVYSGDRRSITSEVALHDPYAPSVTIADSFLKIPYLDSIITDTHFVTRDRMGRLLTFMSRILKDVNEYPNSLVRGLGIDEHTALLLDITTGMAQTVGVGSAYLCFSDHQAEICDKREPLSFSNISCTRLDPKNQDTLSFASWESTGISYNLTIRDGIILDSPYGP